MNYWLVLLVVVVVVFMFSGGKVEKIPAKLKSSAKSFTSGNKMVVGVLVGLALCWFLGNGLVEGFETWTHEEFRQTCCPNEANDFGGATLSPEEMNDGSNTDTCFKYAFGQGIRDVLNHGISELHQRWNQFQEICQADAGADSFIDQSADECHTLVKRAIKKCEGDCNACDTDTLNVAIGGCAIDGILQRAGPGGNICPNSHH